jgi:hypothetical protein
MVLRARLLILRREMLLEGFIERASIDALEIGGFPSARGVTLHVLNAAAPNHDSLL